MHVLFLTDNFPPETNAPAVRVHEHAREWVRSGHRVTVVTCAPNFPRGEVYPGYRNRWCAREELDGIEVVRVKTFLSANRGVLLRTLDFLSFALSGFVAGCLLRRRPDVVVGTSPQFFAALAAWGVAAVRRVPFVFELRDLWPRSISAVGAVRARWLLGLVERLELFLYARAAAVVAVTESFRQNLVRRGVAPGKIAVVPGGVDLASFRPRRRDAELERELGLRGRFVVGYLGTFGMAHALESVLRAADQLRERTDVLFLLVGDGSERERLAAAVREGGLENVRLVPPRPRSEMPACGACATWRWCT